VKRYIREPGSAQVVSLLGRHEFLSSAITPVEVLSALSRKRRDGDLSEENFAAVLSRIDRTNTMGVGRGQRASFKPGSRTLLNRRQAMLPGGPDLPCAPAIIVSVSF
jgi:hypothetical protein